MAKQNLGRVSVVPKGEYVGGTTYTKLDIVTYNGSSYIALKDTSASPTDTTAWQTVASKGDTGAQGVKGDKGDPGATGATGATGAKGDTGSEPTDERLTALIIPIVEAQVGVIENGSY